MATGRERQGGRIWKEQWGGEDGEGSNRNRKRVTMGKGGEDGKGATGRGERGKRWGRAWGEELARGREISQMDMMGCLSGHRL